MYVFNQHEKKEKRKKNKHLLLILCYLVYCCNIEIKLLHMMVLVWQCIEDIVVLWILQNIFSAVHCSWPLCTTTGMFIEKYPPAWE